jgi:hypothetical protein
MSPRCRGDVKRDVLGRQRRLFPANRRGTCAFSVRDSHAATINVATVHATARIANIGQASRASHHA